MREILFRGKKYKTSVFDETDWVYGSLIDSGNHEQVDIYPWLNGASTMSVRQLVYARMEAVKPETVGQFTGLTDKNGKKIFEGDIVQYYGTYALEVYMENGHTKIRWFDTVTNSVCKDMFFGYDPDAYGECEVIGNIHDNPELMEVK